MDIYVCIFKRSFEQNYLPGNLGQVISGILQALVPMLILNSPHFVSYAAYSLEVHFVLNHQLLCNGFSE